MFIPMVLQFLGADQVPSNSIKYCFQFVEDAGNFFFLANFPSIMQFLIAFIVERHTVVSVGHV